MTSYSLEGSCSDNVELQLARSVRYSSAVTWRFGEIRPGLFALWDYEGHEVYIGDDWNELLVIYRARPVYITKPRNISSTKPSKLGLDLGKLEINL